MWAIDLGGKEQPSILFTKQEEITVRGISPDGRYVLLVKQLGLAKGDLRALPYLLDRQTGQLTGGKEMEINLDALAWSGRGFWVNWLVELDLQLGVNTHEALRQAVGSGKETRLVEAVVSADGSKVAALLAGADDRMDLVVGDTKGSHLLRITAAVKARQSQGDPMALVLISPDGKYVGIIGESPQGALVNTANPEPKAWVQFRRDAWPMDRPSWSPDSAHLFIPGTGVIDLTGTLVLAERERGIWNRDGSGLIIPGKPYKIISLGGSATTVDGPADTWAHGFLPDGKLIISRFEP